MTKEFRGNSKDYKIKNVANTWMRWQPGEDESGIVDQEGQDFVFLAGNRKVAVANLGEELDHQVQVQDAPLLGSTPLFFFCNMNYENRQ